MLKLVDNTSIVETYNEKRERVYRKIRSRLSTDLGVDKYLLVQRKTPYKRKPEALTKRQTELFNLMLQLKPIDKPQAKPKLKLVVSNPPSGIELLKRNMVHWARRQEVIEPRRRYQTRRGRQI